MATMIDDNNLVTETQMEQWAGISIHGISATSAAAIYLIKQSLPRKKLLNGRKGRKNLLKGQALFLMACLAVHAKKMDDKQFIEFLPLIVRESTDKRNFVRKAVNWALRQTGKRNMQLHKEALEVAERLIKSENTTARWIGKDAYRELMNEKIINRLKSKGK